MKAILIRWFGNPTTKFLKDQIARMDEILNEHNANK
jgi:hypothetical protein